MSDVRAEVADGVITLTFPEPIPTVNLLHGCHWSRKLKERRKWGWYAQAAALEMHRLPTRPPLPVQRAVVTVTRYGARLVDQSNLIAGYKWLEDSLVESGFFVDDSPEHVQLLPPRQHIGTERKTVITIEGGKR